MTLAARPAPECYAVDTSEKLTLAMARAIYEAGWRAPDGTLRPVAGIGRYVSLNRPNPAGDISADELEAICSVAPGFGCWLVQHVRYGVGSKSSPDGWTPSAQMGGFDGMVARRHAALACYPASCHLAMDLEGVNPTAPALVVSTHCDAWAESVEDEQTSAPSYEPLLYDGYSAGLSPEELWERPNFRLYWGAPGARPVAHRGFALEQIALDVEVAGVRVDVSRISAGDALGGRLVWCVAA